MDAKTTELHLRLSNCLETIIDLERELESMELGHVLLSEFDQLKSFLGRIDQVTVKEEDVRRIEAATSNFLDELKIPLRMVKEEFAPGKPMQ